MVVVNIPIDIREVAEEPAPQDELLGVYELQEFRSVAPFNGMLNTDALSSHGATLDLAAIGIGLSVALFKRKETRPADSTDPTKSRNEHLEGAV